MLTSRLTSPIKRILLKNSKCIMFKLKPYSCLCSKGYFTYNINSLNDLQKFTPLLLRNHSTKSDLHQQKVVIETAPKIVLEKVESQLPEDKINKLEKTYVRFKSAVYPYIQISRLNSPIGIWLLYWPCTWSIALAAIDTGAPLSQISEMLALFFAGSVVMRSAGCVINDMWDKDIDAKVERTRLRPLVTGAITQRQALTLLAAQLSVGLTILLQLNWFSVALGASSMVLVVTYPLAKRITRYPQFWLGATFNWGALLGYSALTGELAPACIPLYMAAVSWTVLYDTIYAHQDKIDDARSGVSSCAVSWRGHDKHALGAACGSFVMSSGAAGLVSGLGVTPALGAALAAVQLYKLDVDDPKDCARRFHSNKWIGFVILLAIAGSGYGKYKENREKNITLNT